MRDETRIRQAQALADDARTLLWELEEEGGHSPVDNSRLIQTRQYLNQAIATLDWFTRHWPDDRDAS